MNRSEVMKERKGAARKWRMRKRREEIRRNLYWVFFPSSSPSSSMRAFWEGVNFSKLIYLELLFSHWALFSRMALNASHSSPWKSPNIANVLHQSSVWGKGWEGLILGLNKHQDWLWICHHVVQFAWRRLKEHLSQSTLFQMITKEFETKSVFFVQL